jgi:hypothetical protein
MLHQPIFERSACQDAVDMEILRELRNLSALEMDAFDANIPTHLFGLALINSNLKTAARTIAYRAARNRRSTVHFANAHCINMLKSDSNYAAALQNADAVLPDGSGLALAARISAMKPPSSAFLSFFWVVRRESLRLFLKICANHIWDCK